MVDELKGKWKRIRERYLKRIKFSSDVQDDFMMSLSFMTSKDMEINNENREDQGMV
jgi:hypothetical protein